MGNNGDGAVIIRVSDVIWPISTHNGNEGYQEKQTNHLLHCIRYLFNAPVIVEPNHQENYHFFLTLWHFIWSGGSMNLFSICNVLSYIIVHIKFIVQTKPNSCVAVYQLFSPNRILTHGTWTADYFQHFFVLLPTTPHEWMIWSHF